LEKEDVQKKSLAQTHTPSALHAILIPSRDLEIVKDLVICEQVAAVGSTERQVEEQPVAIPHRRVPQSGVAPEFTEPEQSFKTISIRNGHPAYLKQFRYSYHRHMRLRGIRRKINKQISRRQR
jgi:hypothetical protein